MAGRPRSTTADRALLEATVELLVRDGYAALSLTRVAERAAVSRPALYRRYPNRTALATAVLIDRFGLAVGDDDTGGLESDLRKLQQHQRDLFCDPVLRAALAGLLADLDGDPAARERFSNDFLAPRRRSTAKILHRAEYRGEITPGWDADWICDLITGPFLMRACLPIDAAIDDVLVDQTVRAALATLGASWLHGPASPR